MAEFKEALNDGISKLIPSKFTSSKRNLPWITQDIRREIRNRDHLFQKFRKSKNPSDRKAFLKSKHAIKKKLKLAHDKYLEVLLGIHDRRNSQENSKSTF